jgi:AraC family transcriptional regulator
MDLPDIQVLHKSDFYEITNYKCNCKVCHTSPVEYTQAFNICFIRSGYFEFKTFRDQLEAHIGRILVNKPGAEHITRHIENQPDVCVVFEFTDVFFSSIKEDYKYRLEWFFRNNDKQSVLLPCSTELEYLYQSIIEQTTKSSVDNLLIDEWVLRLVEKVFGVMTNEAAPSPISDTLKRYHLSTIEKAKDYILTHFFENLNIQQIAQHCCLSVFHFSRIFKSVMGKSPYQYLIEIRLQHANVLIEMSSIPIYDIAMHSGFNSLEHFDNAYRQHFQRTPTDLRKLGPKF